jgi:hypothetical protein
VFRLDRRGERVELRRVMDTDLEADFIARGLNGALGGLDRQFDLLDFLDSGAELGVERPLGQQIVSALWDAGILRRQRISG